MMAWMLMLGMRICPGGAPGLWTIMPGCCALIMPIMACCFCCCAMRACCWGLG